MYAGFKAKNHGRQVAKRGALDDVDDRRTRPAEFDPLHARHGFTIDVAASDENFKVPRYCTAQYSGLTKSWAGERVWCNPPYSNIAPWVKKAREECQAECTLAVLLLPANRCEQPWWQEHIEPFRDRNHQYPGFGVDTRFLPNRRKFDWPTAKARPAKGDRPPFGLVVVTFFGKNYF